jgi:hypothetical protein
VDKVCPPKTIGNYTGRSAAKLIQIKGFAEGPSAAIPRTCRADEAKPGSETSPVHIPVYANPVRIIQGVVAGAEISVPIADPADQIVGNRMLDASAQRVSQPVGTEGSRMAGIGKRMLETGARQTIGKVEQRAIERKADSGA